ncbi:hypothetical protein EVAR_871_1 [Eumeta japonica]|uniref:Uncharacterized protein n=1 Tax=Eumeta variegata TaxID=151549 RepID=A0A4C1SGM2_EUMVA|nr:hypothetical protein EVAR_871_1 [Eumeta japonica]
MLLLLLNNFKLWLTKRNKRSLKPKVACASKSLLHHLALHELAIDPLIHFTRSGVRDVVDCTPHVLGIECVESPIDANLAAEKGARLVWFYRHCHSVVLYAFRLLAG